ncbi:hypothetical protein AVEN_171640-1 [Araneus ventricosus]|uniref:Uncharacterized protein n=1 Tax=Araneus ventricosus TaxID=182803 RepID=A0A4Y2F2Q6_ARAVE|nr:hypothetical protein AVEN_171640-1 [Araneus ventricosus]
MLSQKPLYKRSGMQPCIIVQKKPRARLLQMWPYTNTSQEPFEHLAVKLTVYSLTMQEEIPYGLCHGSSNSSDSTLMVNSRSCCKSSRTLSMFVPVLLVVGRPLRCSSSTLSSPSLNLIKHAYTVFNVMVSSPYACFSIA